MESGLGPLVMSPYNVNRAVREKVLSRGVNSLLPRERTWWNDMMQRERNAVRLRVPILSEYYNATAAPEPPVVQVTVPTQDEAQSALNRRLKSTLRKARSAERRRNRRTQRQLWKELANIGQEYQQQGRRYSDRMRELKAELNAPKPVVPIPVAKPVVKKGRSTTVVPIPSTVVPQTVPLSIKMPVPRRAPSMPPLLPVEETYREPPESWEAMPPLSGGRSRRHRTRKNKYRGRK